MVDEPSPAKPTEAALDDNADWLREVYTRICKEANERKIEPAVLVTGLSGIIGNLIAVNFEESAHRMISLRVGVWIKSSIDHVIDHKQPRN